MSNLKGRFPGGQGSGFRRVVLDGEGRGACCSEFMEDLGITKVMGLDSIKINGKAQHTQVENNNKAARLSWPALGSHS